MFCLSFSTFMYLWAIYIFPGSVCLFCCKRSQIHECRNWEWGSVVSFLGIHKWDFRYSVKCRDRLNVVVQTQTRDHKRKAQNVSFSSESFLQRLIFCRVGVNFLINLFGKGCVVYCPVWQHAVAATQIHNWDADWILNYFFPVPSLAFNSNTANVTSLIFYAKSHIQL